MKSQREPAALSFPILALGPRGSTGQLMLQLNGVLSDASFSASVTGSCKEPMNYFKRGGLLGTMEDQRRERCQGRGPSTGMVPSSR